MSKLNPHEAERGPDHHRAIVNAAVSPNPVAGMTNISSYRRGSKGLAVSPPRITDFIRQLLIITLRCYVIHIEPPARANKDPVYCRRDERD
ncbi:hypothetical protein NPIL_324991 [Nephila pilipes]|uniref:Uncharacterized protein n=1 Tax=Nephila pilipes TaxID=299642 RepID=A0A8X6MUJ6_NEPPI|nr:hypothetical protein NPIL_324991 [Nephila pilipes]